MGMRTFLPETQGTQPYILEFDVLHSLINLEFWELPQTTPWNAWDNSIIQRFEKSVAPSFLDQNLQVTSQQDYSKALVDEISFCSYAILYRVDFSEFDSLPKNAFLDLQN